MYQILSKMKNRFPRKQWLAMVKQAYDAKKITDDEYRSLLPDKKENV